MYMYMYMYISIIIIITIIIIIMFMFISIIISVMFIMDSQDTFRGASIEHWNDTEKNSMAPALVWLVHRNFNREFWTNLKWIGGPLRHASQHNIFWHYAPSSRLWNLDCASGWHAQIRKCKQQRGLFPDWTVFACPNDRVSVGPSTPFGRGRLFVVVCLLCLFYSGEPTTTHEESDDDRKIQNQSFAPAYRGPGPTFFNSVRGWWRLVITAGTKTTNW